MLKVRLSMGEIHYTESGEGPPLLLLHANPGDARDLASSAKKDGAEARRSIPHAEFEVMHCGHAPFAEIPEVFLERVLRFPPPLLFTQSDNSFSWNGSLAH